jgi:type I restriction-modification system DNA methylase subunit
VDNNWIDKVIQVPGKTFIDTAIATVILVLKKNKTTTNIEFADNELGLSRIVALDEIVVNDYNLSVNAYVQKQQVREVLDPWELQKGARANTLKQLEKDLEFDRMVCQIEGYDFNEYLDIKIQAKWISPLLNLSTRPNLGPICCGQPKSFFGS